MNERLQELKGVAMKDKFYVMYRHKSAVGGFTKILETHNQKCAEKIVRSLDPTLNGKPMRRITVWTQAQFDRWLKAESILQYRARTRRELPRHAR